MNRFFVLLLSGIAAILSACESAPDIDLVRNDLAPPIYQTPDSLFAGGLFFVNVSVNGTEIEPFILDTGATKSIIFERTARKLGLPLKTNQTTVVHGILKSSRRPVVVLDNLTMGQISANNIPVAILDDRDQNQKAAGIIGMDILRQYSIHFDKNSKTLSLYTPGTEDTSIYQGWHKTELFNNPYAAEDFGLAFLYLSLGGDQIPSIFDLGAAISFANWEAAQAPDAQAYRKKLRREWELEGANGIFRPQMYARFEAIRGQSYTWQEIPVFITDLEALNIIGSEKKPLMIAGADMFRETSFFADFANKRLYLRTSRAYYDPRKENITGSRIRNAGSARAFTCGKLC